MAGLNKLGIPQGQPTACRTNHQQGKRQRRHVELSGWPEGPRAGARASGMSMQGVLKATVESFRKAVPLRMEGSGGNVINVKDLTEGGPQGRSELRPPGLM